MFMDKLVGNVFKRVFFSCLFILKVFIGNLWLVCLVFILKVVGFWICFLNIVMVVLIMELKFFFICKDGEKFWILKICLSCFMIGLVLVLFNFMCNWFWFG